MHPLDTNDRRDLLREKAGLGMCNITKCCTEVCPEHIKITDNAIIPLKERVVDNFYDPLVWLGRKIRAGARTTSEALSVRGLRESHPRPWGRAGLASKSWLTPSWCSLMSPSGGGPRPCWTASTGRCATASAGPSWAPTAPARRACCRWPRPRCSRRPAGSRSWASWHQGFGLQRRRVRAAPAYRLRERGRGRPASGRRARPRRGGHRRLCGAWTRHEHYDPADDLRALSCSSSSAVGGSPSVPTAPCPRASASASRSPGP